MKVRVTTGQGEVRLEAAPGARLDDLILGAGMLLDRPCGGRGVCGKCAVQVTGETSPPSEAERKLLGASRLASVERLACQTRAVGDLAIDLGSREAIFTDKNFSTGAELAAQRGDLGLAIDLGSTTVAAFLVNVDQGKVLAGAATLNQQASFGAEIMSRLFEEEKRPRSLRGPAWSSAREAIAGLNLPAAIGPKVKRAVVVGNAAMHHLALGLPVASLLRSPFAPSARGRLETSAAPLAELFSKLESIVFPPLLGGFVGSDALACLLYFGLDGSGEPTLAVDLGTNGEVMASSAGRVLVASTAAGPAFEGVNISRGMRAAPGAITRMSFAPDGRPCFETVAGAAARGLAGSGLLSVTRRLVELGAIERSGRFTRDALELKGLVLETAPEARRIRLTDSVWITQPDVRELQKAKAAIRAACDILLERLGLRPSELGRVILTGSFGARIDPEDAIILGALPRLDPALVRSIPNGAGLGAAMMLDPEELARAIGLAARVEHVELNAEPSFMDRYVEKMELSS